MPEETEQQTASEAPDTTAEPDLTAELAAARAQTAAALAAYRTKALELEPELPPDLVAGASIEELDASLGRARGIVENVRSRVQSTVGPSSPPLPTSAGGAERRPRTVDTSSMSATEKIAAGLEARRRR